MPFFLRFLLLLLAGASIMGARHATRQSQATVGGRPSPAMRPLVPAEQATIATLTSAAVAAEVQ
jgi:hypothetical protein